MVADHGTTRVRRVKLLRPELGSGLVPRPRLLARLDDGRDKPLTLVSALAGCGKTTLLCEWLATVDVPVAWLSLDEGDGDIVSFVEHLIRSLQSVAPALGRSTLGLLQMADAPSAADLASEMGDELLALRADVILVLDDYHAVDSSEVDEFLSTLLRYPPPHLRLVLASRVDPFLPLARLRAHGMLAEVRSADLRFTDGETRDLLRDAIDREPDPETVDLLQKRTEGWIAGLRLATLALREQGDLSALPGAESSMLAFLADEIVAGQPEDVQRFLLRTAVPARLCADLCDVLFDPDPVPMASQGMLERLERAGLFVIPLGEDRYWYRYHPLFRELLMRRLEQAEGKAEVRRLHGRTADWLAAHGQVEDAIPHALGSDDPAAAADIVSRHLQPALAERRWTAVERWLGLLPPEQNLGRVDLLLARAWVQRLRGQVDAMILTLDRAELLVERHAETAGPTSTERWRAEVEFLRHMFLPEPGAPVQATLEAATRAIAAIPWQTQAAASPALIPAGVARSMLGDRAGAVRMLSEALTECADRTDPFALHRAHCASLGLMAVWLNAGDLGRFRKTADDLLDLATSHGLGWGAAAAHAYLGVHAYELDHLEVAIDHFAAATDEPEASSIVLVPAFLGLAFAYELCGRRSDADATVNRYLDRLIATDAAAAIPTVRSFQARLALTRGNLAAAHRWLLTTPAPVSAGMVHEFELPLLTRVKVLVAEGSPDHLAEADAALDGPLHDTATGHSVPLQIALLAHLAMVQQAQGRLDAALETIAQAIALAEPHGFFRTFVDLGLPMAELLDRYVHHAGMSPLAGRVIAAIQRPPSAEALTLVPGDGRLGGGMGIELTLDDPPIMERLTEREMDVLGGLAQRMSNKEIAEALAISPHTIKRHTASIYGKLGVSSRRQAVRQAVKAGLVPAD